jgi:uncharacterized protein YjdB
MRVTVTTIDGGHEATCIVTVTDGTISIIGDMIPLQPVLPAGTPTDIGIVSAEPIMIIPADSSDISLETDMLSTIMPDIKPEDLHVNRFGIITVEDWLAKRIAEKLLSIDLAEAITIPVFETVLNNPGETLAASYQVKGRHLMVDGLISRPENVRLLKVLSADSGDWYTYTNNAAVLNDRKFTIQNMSNDIFSGSLEHDGDYKLLFLIKDGGGFDLDKQTDGAVWDPMAFIGVPVTGVTLTPDTLTISVNSAYDLSKRVSIIPSIADNPEVVWSMKGDSAIASVDQSGIVTANSDCIEGTVTVTVTTLDGGYTASCAVTVTTEPIYTRSIVLNKTFLPLLLGNSEKLIATIIPDNATDLRVTWSCNNQYVARIDQTGLVTAIGPGSATITVRTEDGGFEATCYVSVSTPASSVSISPFELYINAGEIYFLMVTVEPFNVSDANVIWSNSNETAATVTQGGLLRTIAAGTTTITATAADGSGVFGTCTVHVIAPNAP